MRTCCKPRAVPREGIHYSSVWAHLCSNLSPCVSLSPCFSKPVCLSKPYMWLCRRRVHLGRAVRQSPGAQRPAMRLEAPLMDRHISRQPTPSLSCALCRARCASAAHHTRLQCSLSYDASINPGRAGGQCYDVSLRRERAVSRMRLDFTNGGPNENSRVMRLHSPPVTSFALCPPCLLFLFSRLYR